MIKCNNGWLKQYAVVGHVHVRCADMDDSNSTVLNVFTFLFSKRFLFKKRWQSSERQAD